LPLPTSFPRVSVIVPTRDRADLLERCTAGLLQRTDYPEMELVIVDNDTREPDAQALLESLSKESRVHVVCVPGPFNFSALINIGVSAANGDVIVFFNNDVDVIDHGWLRELVSQAIRPEVGAKLLYPDTRVQYAGTVLGVGNPDGGPGVADHFGVHAARSDVGYMGFLALARRVSAVTAACMALRKDVFEAVGGMDAENLAVAYNDVDLCLRIGARGLSIIWTPFAELFHLESASRGPDDDSDKAERFEREWNFMRKRWGATLERDPFRRPNTSWGDNTFQLAFPPRRENPWRKYMQTREPASPAEAPETKPTPRNAVPAYPR
jgi:O-antigen biosynthesis protein